MLVLASASPRRQDLLRNAGIPFTVQAADVDETPLASESARDCAERLAREKARAVFLRRPNDLVLGADTVVTVEGQILGKPVDGDDAARMLRMLSGRTHQVVTGACLMGHGSSQGPKPEVSSGESGTAKISAKTLPRPEEQTPGAKARTHARRFNGTSELVPFPFSGELGVSQPVPGVPLQESSDSIFVDVRSETTLVTMSSLSDDDIRSYVAMGEPMDKAGAYAIQGIASRWITRIEGDYFNVVGLPVALVRGMLREHGWLEIET